MKVALVTGAGSGIGRATAEALVREGYAVAMAGRRVSALEQSKAHIEQSTGAAGALHVVAADLAQWPQAQRLVDTVVGRLGRLDALINSAAVVEAVPLAGCDPDHVERLFRTNLYGPLALIVQAWPQFQRQGHGVVVNVSSITAQDGPEELAVYAASKAALESLTRTASTEGGPLSVEAYCVAPGAVETPMLRSLLSEREMPRSRTLAPDAIAAVIADCVCGRRRSDRGRVITLRSPGDRRES